MLQRRKCRLAWCCFQFAANFQNQQCQLALLLSFKRICVALHVTLFLSVMPVENCCWIGQLRDSETKAKRRRGRGRSFKCHLFDFLVGAQSPRHTPPYKTSTKNEKHSNSYSTTTFAVLNIYLRNFSSLLAYGSDFMLTPLLVNRNNLIFRIWSDIWGLAQLFDNISHNPLPRSYCR